MLILRMCAAFTALFIVFFFSSPTFAAFGLEQTVGEVQKGSDITFQTDIPTVVGNIIGTALSLISVAFFILMIYGGLRWMFSRGNEDEAKKALDIIIAAIIGMLIVLGSYAITTFVFKSVGGGDDPQTDTGTFDLGTGPVVLTQCEVHYQSAGLACAILSNCNTASPIDLKPIYDAKKKGTLSSDSSHITGLCPGAANVVCCISK